MANLKVGNTTIGKISVIEPPEVPIVENDSGQDPWVRPSHWLDMPVIGSGEHKAAFLYAVPSGEGTLSNYAGIGVMGPDDPSIGNTNFRLTDFTVDWGDGSSEYVNQHYGSTVTLTHTYDFAQLDENTEFDFNGVAHRQAMVVVDASASGIDVLNWRFSRGSQRQYPMLPILELNINAPSGTNLGVWWDTYTAPLTMLEKARVYAPKVKYLNSFFAEAVNLRSVELTTSNELIGMRHLFDGCHKLDYLPDFETSGVETCAGAFANMKSIKVFPSGKYDFRSVYANPSNSRWAGFNSMFYGSDFEEIHIDIPGNYLWTSSMFSNCEKLKKITGNWDTSNLVNAQRMFENCYQLESCPDMDLYSVVNLSYAFKNCTKIKKIPKINFPFVNDALNAFVQCRSVEGSLYIEDIGSSGLPTGRFDSMFNGMYKIKRVDFSGKRLHTSNTYGMSSMFGGCHNLEYAGYINFSGVSNISSTFAYCHNLRKVAGINARDATSVGYSFYACYNLKDVGDFQINTSSGALVNIDRLFYYCTNLKVPQLDLSRVFYANEAFVGCEIDSYDCDFSSTTYQNHTSYNASRYYFNRLKHINSLTIPSGAYLNSTFSGNWYLKTVPFIDASNGYSYAGLFNNCYNLEQGALSGTNVSIGYYRTCLSSGAITDVFDNLASGVTGQTIDIRYTPGTYDLHSDTIAVATNKGWTVLT
jgi:hypothetical protein